MGRRRNSFESERWRFRRQPTMIGVTNTTRQILWAIAFYNE
jgi:hypothetical protein